MLRWALLSVALLSAGSARAEPSTRDLDWFDESRQRAVPVRLYWPEGAKRVPLVVFSHGIGGSRLGYSYLGQYFASHGMASLHLQHVGSDRSLWGGNPLSLVGRLQDAAQEREALERVKDLSFSLDQVLAHEEFGKRIDRKRIAAAGHSYGANTVMLAAGAAIEREGRRLSMRDARIKVAVLLSAPPFYGEEDLKAILKSITLPTLHVTATEDVIRIPGFFSPASDRVAVFEAVGSPLKALAVFEGGSHSIFTNRIGTGGSELNPKVKAATKELALAFLQRVFEGKGEALQRWPETYRPLLARWTSPGTPAAAR
jgi:pimeloyl-ACP methyl ester carboxylesterase